MKLLHHFYLCHSHIANMLLTCDPNPVSATPSSPIFGVWNILLVWALDLVHKDADDECHILVSSFLVAERVNSS